jgi:hypothetical protein
VRRTRPHGRAARLPACGVTDGGRPHATRSRGRSRSSCAIRSTDSGHDDPRDWVVMRPIIRHSSAGADLSVRPMGGRAHCRQESHGSSHRARMREGGGVARSCVPPLGAPRQAPRRELNAGPRNKPAGPLYRHICMFRLHRWCMHGARRVVAACLSLVTS